MSKALLSLNNVKMHFPVKKSFSFIGEKQYVKAVDGITIDIYENEILGLVGESGCGKSSLGRVILGLYPQTEGEVTYNGQPLSIHNKEELRKLRKELQIIFQDPYSSLNPRLTVGQLISEAVIAHKIFTKKDKALEDYIVDIMEKCGLQKHMLHRYPHQFSGGQRQRISIARALALNPKFVVCDECISTLDVSIQSQIINLLLDLKKQNNLTYLFISHDLSTVRFISDRIAVMYLGNIVELSEADSLFSSPLHPYTKALISSIPSVTEDSDIEANIIEGDVPSPINPPAGCKFHPRCKYAKERCMEISPKLRKVGDNRFIACHFPLV